MCLQDNPSPPNKPIAFLKQGKILPTPHYTINHADIINMSSLSALPTSDDTQSFSIEEYHSSLLTPTHVVVDDCMDPIHANETL